MKILFFTLNNIGDAILTLPVLDYLRRNHKTAAITCLTGERPQEIFQGCPQIERVIVFNKQSPWREKIKLFFSLSRQKFDLVVDLRNSFLGAVIPARRRSGAFLIFPRQLKHMMLRHLFRAGAGRPREPGDKERILQSTLKDRQYIDGVFAQNNISGNDALVAVAPGARSRIKRWPKENFIGLCSNLRQQGYRVILVGDKNDLPIAEAIKRELTPDTVNLCAKTNLRQLAVILEKVKLLITNDSAISHLGSYLDIPVLAIFGPTDDARYGPWSKTGAVVKKEIFCRPCLKAQCRFGNTACLSLIKVNDVLRQAKNLLLPQAADLIRPGNSDFKRILIMRTDRLGDVLLSTPVIAVLREKYPNAYIAMMVAPQAREAVEGNPSLDEVIVLDKAAPAKGFFAGFRFIRRIRQKKFDLAIILHPAIRAHLIAYFSGITRRIGYDRKFPFLLTDKIKHLKQEGKKHEADYNFDLLKLLGIEEMRKDLFIPISLNSEKWAEDLFKQEGILPEDNLLAIHPGASCPSKIWMPGRFAQVAQELTKLYGFKVLLLAGPGDIASSRKVAQDMRVPFIDLSGKCTVNQLACLLKKCKLLIANDSGPVHVASAVGTPVISIFGRSQDGLSPRRWGPLGKKSKVLHKQVGCLECLAHNCQKEFACLRAITAEDVVAAACEILNPDLP